MALFRRNKTDATGMPKEVQDYYKAEGRERTGVAWLLALGTLLVTILVVLGLFMGGRWAFRQLKDNDSDQPQVAVQEENHKETSHEEPSQSSANSGSSSSSSGSSSQPNSGSSNSSNSQSSGSSSSTTQPSNSSTNSSNQNLAETGPGDTLAIFAAVSVLAYLAHRRFLAD